MGWPKGKPRKPKPAPQDGEQIWKDIAADRDRVMRTDRTEPESRQEGTLRGDGLMRADPQDDVVDFLENEAMTQQLPSPPKKAGWHHFWASTTNKQTPVQMFLRMGYVFVHPDEIPEWLHMKAHSASFSQELLQCNEMILMKIPEDKYQRIMKHLHHDKPMSEAERLLVNLELLKQDVGRDSKGNSLVKEEGDGLASILDRKVRSGAFE